jgi:hypothetical protein
MNNSAVLVKVTKAYEVNPARPRPKWWDRFIGETFLCIDSCSGWWTLTNEGLDKLQKLKGVKTYGAILNKDCGKLVARVYKKDKPRTNGA